MNGMERRQGCFFTGLKRKTSTAVNVAIVAFFSGRFVGAQSESSGRLMGTVANAQSAAIPGAAVKVSNAATGFLQNATTSTDGRYGFPTLAPGTYEVELSAKGFKTTRMTGVVVNVAE